MSEVSSWLSLKVLDAAISGSHPRNSSLLISIPKKIVRLATRRNRIKRLVREAFRKETLIRPGKVYQFRVVRSPEKLDLKEVQETVSQLIVK